MPACDLVVVGSYPPIPGPATAATLAAVRRGWQAGWTVQVVSYRTGAAPLTVPVVGPLAGRRLGQVRRHLAGPPRLVLNVQAGVPFSDQGFAKRLVTAAGLAMAMRRFKHVTLLVADDLEIPRTCFWALARGADCISVATSEDARRLQERYPVRQDRVSVDEVEPFPPGPALSRDNSCDLGLYSPGAAKAVALADLPETATVQRARERARRLTSSLVPKARAKARTVLHR